MNYILLANPREWQSYHPNQFDINKKVSYVIDKKNRSSLINARVGERALLIITGRERKIKFEAVVSEIGRAHV